MTTYYSFIIPITHTIPADRQGAKRYYGVHPYFTRRPYNVIKKYILHYSREGDCVLDPFGGSGVTAIEAFLENRTGIQNDINPLANFIANSTVDLVKGKISDLYEALSILEDRCKSRIAKVNSLSDKGLAKYKRSIKLPENVLLPKTSDVGNYHDLFSLKQMLSLAILKKEIDSLPNKHSRSGMLLAWSATLGKLNKTFLSAEGRAESRGGSSIFSIYRYKIAGNPVELPPWESFYERAINIINAKKEIDKEIEFKKRTNGWRGKYECYSKDVEDLTEELEGTIDYIFTDPPYGGNISYIDLSILWNSWLGFLPDARTREKELIVGGELKLSEKIYKTRLYDSIKACVRMLKTNRWFSIVFQHWNVSYFEAILNSAHDSGAELKAAISQVGDPIWSMHKKKMKESVLAGEFILTFQKTGRVKVNSKNMPVDASIILDQMLSNIHDKQVYGESLFNKLIIEAWKRSAISSLNMTKSDFVQLLRERGWFYDERNHYWTKERKKYQLFPSIPV